MGYRLTTVKADDNRVFDPDSALASQVNAGFDRHHQTRTEDTVATGRQDGVSRESRARCRGRCRG